MTSLRAQLSGEAEPAPANDAPVVAETPKRSGFWTFLFGFIVGAAVLFGLALVAALRSL